jgi:hypothetical protein
MIFPRDDEGSLEDELLTEDADADDVGEIGEGLPTGCLSVLTRRTRDLMFTIPKENKLAGSGSGCYAVHQEI